MYSYASSAGAARASDGSRFVTFSDLASACHPFSFLFSETTELLKATKLTRWRERERERDSGEGEKGKKSLLSWRDLQVAAADRALAPHLI